MSLRRQYIDGLKSGLPITPGVAAVGIAFAISAAEAGLTPLQSALMSFMVLAGASQIAAVTMFAQGAGAFAIAIATFVINLRFLIMSVCVMNRVKGARLITRMLASWFVVDESFALFTTAPEEKCTPAFFFGIGSALVFSWVPGTFIGSMATALLPPLVSDSLGITIYALFIALLVPGVRKSLRLGATVLVTAALSFALSRFMPSSWSVVTATLLGALIGVFITGSDVREGGGSNDGHISHNNPDDDCDIHT